MLKKIIRTAMVVTALTASLSAAPMTGDEIISKHIAAVGGESAIRAVKNLTMTGSMFAQGMTLEMKMQVAVPDKAYMEVSMNKMVVQSGGVNGSDAWTGTPMGKFMLGGEMKAKSLEQTDIFPFLDYKKKGAKAKFVGDDLVKGTKALRVEFVSPSNDTTNYYFDATSYYMLKKKDTGSTSTMSDYKKVGGILMPYKLQEQGEMGSAMITLDTIYVNSSIPDSVFSIPKDAKPYEELQKMMQQMQQMRQGGGGTSSDTGAAKKDTTGGKK